MDNSKIANLAINDYGFIFDPTTGHSYNANKTALMVLGLVREGKNRDEVTEALLEHFDIESDVLQSDLDFLYTQLEQFGLSEGE